MTLRIRAKISLHSVIRHFNLFSFLSLVESIFSVAWINTKNEAFHMYS